MPLGGGRLVLFRQPDSFGAPTHSIDFGSATTESLSISDTNFGVINSRKFSISYWIKKKTTSTISYHCAKTTAVATTFRVDEGTAGKYRLAIHKSNGGTSAEFGQIESSTALDDTDWHHVLWHVDLDNGTAGDRMKLWVDGTEVTTFDTDTNPTSEDLYADAGNMTHSIAGGDGDPSTTTAGNCIIYQWTFFNAYLADIGDVYSGGVNGMTELTGNITSQLDTEEGVDVGNDVVLATDWTIHGTPTASTDIPT